MKTLLSGCAIVAATTTGFYLADTHITDTADAILLAYVGAVSLATATMTTRRTYKWTALGVGLLFSAIAIGVEGLTNSAYRLGLIDLEARVSARPVADRRGLRRALDVHDDAGDRRGSPRSCARS